MQNINSRIAIRSREDFYILEKHSQDIFKMLLKHLIVIDSASEIREADRVKTERLLAEYLETKAVLTI